MVVRVGVVMETGNVNQAVPQGWKFTAQYRHEAAHLVIDSGRTIAEVATELGLGAQLLGKWVKAEKESMEPEALTPDERAELKRAREENAKVPMDNEFQGLAAALQRARSISE